VKIEASSLERRFSIGDLNDGGGVTPAERYATATAIWKDEWCEGWSDGDS
jgi:hypothetical protein